VPLAEAIAEIEDAEPPPDVDAALWQELTAELKRVLEARGISELTEHPPEGEHNRITSLVIVPGGDDELCLRWSYVNVGDYNQDGMVSVSDLTEVGRYFNASRGDDEWDFAQLADGNGDGMITVADITGIGQNYLAYVAGYEVLTADSREGPFTVLDTVGFAEILLGEAIPCFEYSLPSAEEGQFFVRAVDAAQMHGDISNRAVVALTRFDGEDSDPAADHVPDIIVCAHDESTIGIDDVSIGGTGLLTSRTRIIAAFDDQLTVAEANALLTEIRAVIIGGDSEINYVVLEIPETGDFTALRQAINTLQANEHIPIAYQVVALTASRVNHPALAEDPEDEHSTWEWDSTEWGGVLGGNWGMEAIRAPQSWNLFDFGMRRIEQDPLVQAQLAIYDVGFNPDHPLGNQHPKLQLYKLDSPFFGGALYFDTDYALHTHGEHIAGIVGAPHYDDMGVAGVDPLLGQAIADDRFIGISRRSTSTSASTALLREVALWDAIMTDIIAACRRWKDLSVVNLSLGFGLLDAEPPIDGNTDAGVQSVAAQCGTTFRTIAARFPNTIFVAAAGNESEDIEPPQFELEARWASPMCWAALDPSSPIWPYSGERYPPSPNVIVVEAAENNSGDDRNGPSYAWHYPKTDFSNVGGQVAAPGDFILSAVGSNVPKEYFLGIPTDYYADYEAWNGTSMAAPHVAGLVSYLKTISGLDAASLVSLVSAPQYTTTFETTGPTPPHPPASAPADSMIDCFAAVIGIDSLSGGKTIQQALVNVDDGTRDGSFRYALLDARGWDEPNDPNPNLIHTADARRGSDGKTTMKDFRPFRDNYAYAHNTDFLLGYTLDGGPAHFKKDFNYDGAVSAVAPVGVACSPPHPVDVTRTWHLTRVPDENVYTRYDFNGDGGVYRWYKTAPYRKDPDTVEGSNENKSLEWTEPPGMLRDIDVLCTAGNWSLDDSGADGSYFENVSVNPDEEGMDAINGGWTPMRYILADRDSALQLPGELDGTPDYLHSCDLHFWLDWEELNEHGHDEVTIRIESGTGIVAPPFERTRTFTSEGDPRKFVVTIPIWNNKVTVYWETPEGCSGTIPLIASLAEDIPVSFVCSDTPVDKPIADFGYDLSERWWDGYYYVQFDASPSFHEDPERTIVEYRWDLDGDGTWDYSDTSPFADWYYPLPGNYSVKLEVVDDADESGEKESDVAIPDYPTWHYSVVFDMGDDYAGYDPDLKEVNNRPAAAWSDLTNDRLLFALAEDPQGIAWREQVVVVEDLRARDQKIVWPLIICQDMGKSNVCGYRANDANGTSWSSQIHIAGDDGETKDYGHAMDALEVNGNPAVCFGGNDPDGHLYYTRSADLDGLEWGEPIGVFTGAIAYDDHSDLFMGDLNKPFIWCKRNGNLVSCRSVDPYGYSWGTYGSIVEGSIGRGFSGGYGAGYPYAVYHSQLSENLECKIADLPDGSSWEDEALTILSLPESPVRIGTANPLELEYDFFTQEVIAYTNAPGLAVWLGTGWANQETPATETLDSAADAGAVGMSIAMINGQPAVVWWEQISGLIWFAMYY
jgi:hypothetical protein